MLCSKFCIVHCVWFSFVRDRREDEFDASNFAIAGIFCNNCSEWQLYVKIYEYCDGTNTNNIFSRCLYHDL